MKKLVLLSIFAFLFFFKNAQAQDGPTHIAIIPFTPSTPNASVIAVSIQTEVAGCFTGKKDRFFLIDRGTTEKIKNNKQRNFC